MWRHFESIHVLQQPTYMSMYHAAQGLILAAGKVVAGHEWWGVYASVSVMCALVCWMLQGWLPLKWALLGGLLAVLRLGLFGYWINSYWGGAAAAIGGLLVLGAWPRVTRRMRIGHMLLRALGIVILANSRPYEGFVLTLTVAGSLAVWMWRRRAVALVRVVLPAAIVLALGAAATMHYYSAVTGSPFRICRIRWTGTATLPRVSFYGNAPSRFPSIPTPPSTIAMSTGSCRNFSPPRRSPACCKSLSKSSWRSGSFSSVPRSRCR
jgi:hypothetical protein